MMIIAGCSGGSSPTDPVIIDSIALDSISPASTTTLTAGSRVTFTGHVRYTLGSASTGHVSIVIQDQSSNRLSTTVPQPIMAVTRGGGTVDLSDSITVPATGVTSVNVFFPLFPAGVTQTSTVQVVRYSVR
jgi:hypothetical protein